jgi:hypothetical protein
MGEQVEIVSVDVDNVDERDFQTLEGRTKC